VISISAQQAKAPVGEHTGINPKDRVGATKPPLSLVPPVALVHCAMAMKNGATKYGPYNWRTEKVQSMIYLDAAMRHIADFIDGEEVAVDSGVHHLAHAMACCAILLDAFEGGFVKDNRPPKGPAPAAIARLTLTK
jgi:hypothetical protein